VKTRIAYLITVVSPAPRLPEGREDLFSVPKKASYFIEREM
jgi:hypothetical protein